MGSAITNKLISLNRVYINTYTSYITSVHVAIVMKPVTHANIACIVDTSLENNKMEHVYDIDNDKFKGILWDFFVFTLEQIIVLNKYCT